MVSPKLLRYASIALILSGIILIVIPILYKFHLIAGEFRTSNVGVGLIFLVLGIRTLKKSNSDV